MQRPMREKEGKRGREKERMARGGGCSRHHTQRVYARACVYSGGPARKKAIHFTARAGSLSLRAGNFHARAHSLSLESTCACVRHIKICNLLRIAALFVPSSFFIRIRVRERERERERVLEAYGPRLWRSYSF